MAKKLLGLPDNLISMLAAADKQRGFPDGTMASVMQQETGGNAKYLNAPDTYHYGLNAEGKRIAGHTGKVSTAFGPFGILESTGRDPGYGVKPLENKTIEEQVRFAADYLGARSKQAGGLQAGLAGYGEGGKYGQQVMARIGNGVPVSPAARIAPQLAQQAPVMAEALPAPMPEQMAPQVMLAQAAPEAMTQQHQPPAEWEAFQKATPEPVQANALAYGGPMAVPPVRGLPGNLQPNFSRFKGFRGLA